MRNLRKPYQMYVLNLDAGRIFWLTTILLLLISSGFFIGFLLGREKAKIDIEGVTQKNKIMMDEILSKLDDKDKDDEDYQFYELISPNRVVDKRKEENYFEYDYVEKKPAPENDRTYRKPSSYRKTRKNNESTSLQGRIMDFGDKRISSKKPYVVQVASYKKYNNAKIFKNYLTSEQYPTYIIKSNVSGVIYYRVRIGPFASKTLSLKVLEMVKVRKGCQSSFITSK